MFSTERTALSPLYADRIKNLHTDKMEINARKMESYGSYDTDDHGFIDFPEFKFTPKVDDPNGVVSGCRAIGENFRLLLNHMPRYINPNSALAGCWPNRITKYVPVGIRLEDRPYHLKDIMEKYNIRGKGVFGMNHSAPDMTIGLELGWGGLLKKVRHYRQLNQPSDADFYDGEELLLLGIQEFVQAHADYASELAKNETDPERKTNYLHIAQTNAWLVENPPRTFLEVCQFIAHFQVIDRIYFFGGALCQLDELLRPYYEADTVSGILTDEQAVWILASLLFNDTHYSQIAGLIPDGSRDMTSRMSFLILDAMHDLNIPANIAVRVNDDIHPVLLRRSLEYLLEDGHGVSYSLSKGIEEGFARNGFPIELARMRAKVGCNWTALPGIEYCLQDVTRCNLAMALSYALKDVSESEDYSLEHLWAEFEKHTKIMVDFYREAFDWNYEKVSRNQPEIVLNLFMHGPIERGLDCSRGGVDIMDICVDGVGLATVADSFAAIERRVVREKKISWERLFQLLDANYANAEPERLMLRNIDRFGTPGSDAEKWAVRVKNLFTDYVVNHPTFKHHIKLVPGLFSHGNIFKLGDKLPATPNGRKANEEISHSSEPDPGFARGIDTFSPTLKANAVAKVQPGYGNSAPLHLDIDKEMIERSGGISALEALIHTHNHMGGTLINLNCLTKKTLLEAHEDPATHPDLLVRVTGYSAFFASLSKEYRQQIVDRFLE